MRLFNKLFKPMYMVVAYRTSGVECWVHERKRAKEFYEFYANDVGTKAVYIGRVSKKGGFTALF